MAFSDSTGIGLSGIGYSLFGFIFIKSKTTEAYRNFLEKKTINLFLLWLVLCVVLTQAKILTVGNAAHVGGLAWGVTMGYISRFDIKKQWAIGPPLIVILTSSIFWSPFSTSWLCHQAYGLHKNQKLDEAKIVYNNILEREPENEFAKDNLKLIEIDKLSDLAFELHKSEKYNEARQIYDSILILDKDNAWAKENISRLPVE